ncbi:monoglyceride lipase-like [Branchiostoma floridae x Branchiostoma japonicum]
MASETGTDPDRCTPQGVSYSTVPHIVNSDGQYLYCRTWEPTQKFRALLFLSHGRGSHCGVLGPILAQLLNNHGFLVFGHDHVGHGQSEGERLCVENFDILARDILQHVDVMRARYPDVPIFLLGHSMGGSAGITAACKRPGQFAGMVLTSPGIENVYTRSYLYVYPNCRHVLLLETPEDAEMVKQDILDWFLARLSTEKKHT